jgi:hypothetical protein
MDARLVANYLSSLKSKTGLTIKAIGDKSERSESTVKKLLDGTTEDPRLDTVAPIIYAMGGSLDEMLNPGKSKDTMKEVSVVSLKEAYEFQLATMKETNEAHIANIRAHYEQHHEDLKENYEKRLSDKREIIELMKEENAKLNHKMKLQEKGTRIGNLIRNTIIAMFVIGVTVLLIMEFLHPTHGWLRW